MTTLEYFRTLAPAFASTADEDVEIWISMAENMVVVECLSDEQQAQATALYAAHLMQITASDASGVVTSEKEGDLSRSYAPLAGSTELIGSTKYGQLYAQLARQCMPIGAITRIGLE